ncbi:class III extradiol dioxygenase subunit B-like domain-containing protein [Rhodococcus coprophilus]|uniref:Uncharacterized conserved protein n=1 Tax=Rhodococcus coprophilus TaxID=38310 RepID=A0A2X4TPW3_9NOCA|nr:class III extradiol dioxygenase subunit B-like domain-containing protein [Rhodococcus coprophilus]MBM7461282.1 hypothetical protein [Rhodococcus coprophilus]SQI29181.1 Uncharacterized conserved protein [Rhodococcus coprophilus]
MFIAGAFVPSPPLLVPELNGLAVAETDELRRAVLDIARQLAAATDWVVVGTGDTSTEVLPTARGTFRGYGADVPVALGPAAAGEPDPELPLAALVAGWMRDRVAPRTSVEVHILADDTDPGTCVNLGEKLRERLDADSVPRALLVVADGPATLTAKAPGAFDPRSGTVDAGLADALTAGDPDALLALDPGLCSEVRLGGRAAWQTLAGVFTAPPDSATVTYSAAPYGVGYHAGMWCP